jgi:hypothetical protein
VAGESGTVNQPDSPVLALISVGFNNPNGHPPPLPHHTQHSSLRRRPVNERAAA